MIGAPRLRRCSLAGRLLAALEVVSRCPAVQALKVLRRVVDQKTTSSKKADKCTCVNSLDDAGVTLPTWTDLSVAGGVFTDPLCAKEFSGKCTAAADGQLTGDMVFKDNVNPPVDYYFDASKNFGWRGCDLKCRTQSNDMCKAYLSDAVSTANRVRLCLGPEECRNLYNLFFDVQERSCGMHEEYEHDKIRAREGLSMCSLHERCHSCERQKPHSVFRLSKAMSDLNPVQDNAVSSLSCSEERTKDKEVDVSREKHQHYTLSL